MTTPTISDADKLDSEFGADPALVNHARAGHGPSKPVKQGAPELAYIAQAIFRASFADDEDGSLVGQKWCEWEEDRAKAIRTAHFVIRALGGWGSVAALKSRARTLQEMK